jgi:hypothetical protein
MVQYGYERVGTLTVETEEPFGTPFHNERFRYGTSSHGDAQVKFCMCLFGSECFNLTTNKPDGGSKNPQSISWSPLESADDGCQFYRISFKPCAGKHAPTTAIQKNCRVQVNFFSSARHGSPIAWTIIIILSFRTFTNTSLLHKHSDVVSYICLATTANAVPKSSWRS